MHLIDCTITSWWCNFELGSKFKLLANYEENWRVRVIEAEIRDSNLNNSIKECNIAMITSKFMTKWSITSMSAKRWWPGATVAEWRGDGARLLSVLAQSRTMAANNKGRRIYEHTCPPSWDEPALLCSDLLWLFHSLALFQKSPF